MPTRDIRGMERGKHVSESEQVEMREVDFRKKTRAHSTHPPTPPPSKLPWLSVHGLETGLGTVLGSGALVNGGPGRGSIRGKQGGEKTANEGKPALHQITWCRSCGSTHHRFPSAWSGEVRDIGLFGYFVGQTSIVFYFAPLPSPYPPPFCCVCGPPVGLHWRVESKRGWGARGCHACMRG
jgi:hypothetical protein